MKEERDWPKTIEWEQLHTQCVLQSGAQYPATDVEVRIYCAQLPGDGKLKVVVHLQHDATCASTAELFKRNDNGSVTISAAYQGADDVAAAVRGVLQRLDLKMKLLAMELTYRP